MAQAQTGLYGSDLKQNMASAAISEFVGTFFLVLAGTAAAVAAILHAPIAGSPEGSLSVALAFGLVLIALASTFGHVSGAHFNPAVSIALAVTGKFSWKYVPAYLIAQLLGATFASYSVHYLYGSPALSLAHLGVTQPAAGVSIMMALFAEFLITFLLMLVIVSVATDPRVSSAVVGSAIGFALAVGVLIGGPISGGAVNPARALGPMFASGDLSYWYIYVIGPIVGAICAAVLYDKFLAKGSTPGK